MAYYDALIAAWNSSIQPPTGVTGTGLSSAQSTAQKLANVNLWTVTGSVPTSLLIAPSDVANCVVYSEFKPLTATQQSNLMNLFGVSGNLLGGSTNVGRLTAGMVLDYFGSSSVTIANLTALAKATVTPWWQAPVASNGGGLTSPVNSADLASANSSIGGLT